MTTRAGSSLTFGAPLAAVATAYWTAMSPYSQLLGAFPFRASTRAGVPAKSVALTFDDGPNEPFTSQIAAYLDHRDIKATFFQVGQCVQRHPEISRGLLASGHVIGNHSYAHRFGRCWTEADIADELRLSQRVFHETIGREPALYRPPWLVRTPATFRVLEEAGLRAVSGEFCHALEPFQPSPKRIARRTLAKVKPGRIVIFHDGYDAKGADRTSTVEAVKIVVDTLIRDGYSFSTVDDLLGIPAYRTESRTESLRP
ncbi:MAG: peptidoglycan-N-acetylglucosamine deacetylase [Actinomycetota bacterium]|nr:peptidoglycan-N-acetylglucosamine deacetylase [Actinomycetota bacterium]